MENKYKLFGEKYNKVLDVIDFADEELAERYKKIIDNLPTVVKDKLSEEEDFNIDSKYFSASVEESDGCVLRFKYTRFDKYIHTEIHLYPFYEDELYDSCEDTGFDENLFVCSIRVTNTKQEPNIQFNYKEEDGKYIYTGCDITGFEIFCDLVLERRDNDYYLITKKELNGFVINEKEIPVTYEELLDYANEAEYDESDYDDLY